MMIAGLVSCSGDELTNEDLYQDPSKFTISNYVKSNPEFSQLNDALEYTGLMGQTDAQAGLKIFLPNNLALNLFLAENGFASIEDVPVDYMRQVLLNHVIVTDLDLTSAAANSELFVETKATQLFNSENHLTAIVKTIDGVPTVNGVSISNETLTFINGRATEINQIIEPSTLFSIVALSDQFSALKNLVELSGDFTEIRDICDQKFTVTNQAPFTLFVSEDPTLDLVLNGNPDGSISAGQRFSDFINAHLSTEGSFYENMLQDGQTVRTRTRVATAGRDSDGNATLTTTGGFFPNVVNILNDDNAIIQTSNGTIQRVAGSLAAQ